MKKFLVYLILLGFTTCLFAEHEVVDNSYFSDYQKDPSIENFNKAYRFYSENKDDFNSKLFLSYLHSLEINSLITDIQADYDSLSTKEKFSFANLLLHLNRLEESLPIYEELNEKYPTWPCPWRHKGEVLMKQGKLQEAEQATIKSIETREDHFDAYVQLAEIQKEMNKPKVALENLNKGLSYHQTDPEGEVSDQKIKALKQELENMLKK